MDLEFKWHEWNINQIEKHGVTRAEAEQAVRVGTWQAGTRDPDAYEVRVQVQPSGKWLHVCFAIEDADEGSYRDIFFNYEATVIFVFHAQQFRA